MSGKFYVATAGGFFVAGSSKPQEKPAQPKRMQEEAKKQALALSIKR